MCIRDSESGMVAASETGKATVMFVALRDLRFAKGRFILIGSVVALITLLVGFLSGLTGGLAIQNVSGVLALPADRIVFSALSGGDDAASFADSTITEQQANDWAATSGVTDARPLGISQTRAETDDTRAAIAVFGVEPGFDAGAPSGDGQLRLSVPAADALGVKVGAQIEIAGVSYDVETVEGDA